MFPTKKEWECALADRHGKEIQRKFTSSTVAICGLGGLGSNVAFSLARAGVGRLILIDFDRVDVSNLHRQQYKADQIGEYKTEALANNLREISPYTVTETHTVRITEENAAHLLESADIICEAFDSAENKAMLTDFVLEKMPKKYYVCASGMAGFLDANTIRTRRITKRFFVCGDGKSDVESAGSLVSSGVMLCAAHQAHTVLRILADKIDG